MLVTIIADASHCQETKGAGYGFWIASNRGKLGGGGSMKEPSGNNVIAEMQAVCNALHIAVKAGLVVQHDRVLIQTDCTPAISGLNGTRPLKHDQEIAVRTAMNELCRLMGLNVEYRHVKGHTNKKEARFVTNNMCDVRAKEGMIKARQRLRAA